MGKKKKHHAEEPESSERWLLTYSDLITLLLGLFVILYAMSQVDKNKYQDFVAALSQQFGSNMILAGNKGLMKDAAPKPGRSEPLKHVGTAKQHQMQQAIEKILEKQIAAGQVNVRATPEGVSISLLEFLLFDSGESDIKPVAYTVLDEIIGFLGKIPNTIRVDGHTDNIPISTPQFPSNWHLSVARAMNTGYYLLTNGIPPERLSIAGYSEYKPVVPNDTDENRAKNRRVEIVILDEKAADINNPDSSTPAGNSSAVPKQ